MKWKGQSVSWVYLPIHFQEWPKDSAGDVSTHKHQLEDSGDCTFSVWHDTNRCWCNSVQYGMSSPFMVSDIDAVGCFPWILLSTPIGPLL